MPIFPIHDGRTLAHVGRPYATWTIIAINVVVYFFFEGGITGEVSFAAVYGFGLIPATYNDYFNLPGDIYAVPDWATLVTYAFLHADFWHLLGNMVFLWVFADNIEDAFGHLRFLAGRLPRRLDDHVGRFDADRLGRVARLVLQPPRIAAQALLDPFHAEVAGDIGVGSEGLRLKRRSGGKVQGGDGAEAMSLLLDGHMTGNTAVQISLRCLSDSSCDPFTQRLANVEVLAGNPQSHGAPPMFCSCSAPPDGGAPKPSSYASGVRTASGQVNATACPSHAALASETDVGHRFGTGIPLLARSDESAAR